MPLDGRQPSTTNQRTHRHESSGHLEATDKTFEVWGLSQPKEIGRFYVRSAWKTYDWQSKN